LVGGTVVPLFFNCGVSSECRESGEVLPFLLVVLYSLYRIPISSWDNEFFILVIEKVICHSSNIVNYDSFLARICSVHSINTIKETIDWTPFFSARQTIKIVVIELVKYVLQFRRLPVYSRVLIYLFLVKLIILFLYEEYFKEQMDLEPVETPQLRHLKQLYFLSSLWG